MEKAIGRKRPKKMRGGTGAGKRWAVGLGPLFDFKTRMHGRCEGWEDTSFTSVPGPAGEYFPTIRNAGAERRGHIPERRGYFVQFEIHESGFSHHHRLGKGGFLLSVDL